MNWTLPAITFLATAWTATAVCAPVGGMSQAKSSDPLCLAQVEELRSQNIVAAARAIGRLGERGACAVDALRAILRHDPSVHGEAAVVALGDIGPTALSAAPDLMDAAFVPRLARQALEALSRLGPGVIVYILPWLDEPHDQFAFQDNSGFAAVVFGRVGAPAIPALLQAINVPSRRLGAVDALGAIGRDAATAVPTLIELYDENADRLLRYGIMKALRDIGPSARDAIPLLERMATAPDILSDDLLKRTAQEALAKIRALQQ